MKKVKIYVASSWRNDLQNEVVKQLREADHEVYDFKNPPNRTGFSWSEIDPNWKEWDAKSFINALETPIAQAGFDSDFNGMNGADVCVLVLPCGRSAHTEAGYMAGQGKKVIVLTDDAQEPELMYKCYSHVTDNMNDVLKFIQPEIPKGKTPNVYVSLHFNGDKVMNGQFKCKQCAIDNVMNTNCLYILNTIGQSLQVCSNCDFDNFFDISTLVFPG